MNIIFILNFGQIFRCNVEFLFLSHMIENVNLVEKSGGNCDMWAE